MSRIPNEPNSEPDKLKYRDMYKLMTESFMAPLGAVEPPNVEEIRPKPRSILRTVLQVYVGEPAWAFVGNPDEEDRLINMLRKAGINLTVGYVGRAVLIELELK